MSDFAKMLELLGRDPAEQLSINAITRGRFTSMVTTVGKAPEMVTVFAQQDCWYGTGVLHPRVTAGRGRAEDVRGVREIFCDLDVKPGGMPSYEAARAVIDDLSSMLGETPAAIVSSGHGLQPHWVLDREHEDPDWPLTDWPDETDSRWRQAVVLCRRWHRLVAHVAEVRGGQVDNVSDLSRVLRVPGTTNCKGEPVAVTVEFPGGGPVGLDRIADTLDEYGITEHPDDGETLDEVVSAPAEWEWAERTCGYAATMVKAWATDTPDARHPWLTSQAVRLACAHRLGCLTEADRYQAVTALVQRFRWLLAHSGERRDEARGEIADVLAWGAARASTYSDHRARRELGNHNHAEPFADLPHEEPEAEARGRRLLLPAEFWTTRPALEHIRAAAWSKGRCPDAVLHVCLARVAAMSPHEVSCETGAGTRAVVNYLGALVDDPGGGKSDAEQIGCDLITSPYWLDDDTFRELPPGSGEGLADLFMGWVSEADPDNPKKKSKVRKQVRHNAYLYLDEGESFTRMGERSGSTLGPALRTAWKGQLLGQQNATQERTRIIGKHKYSLGVVMAFQPGTIEPLLSDNEQRAGTPQRFGYAWATDPGRPEHRQRPAWPGRLAWEPPQAVPPGGYRLDPHIAAQIQSDDDQRGREGSEPVHPLDVHRPLMRVKFALLLMLLDQRTTVTPEDWRLAGELWDASCRVRDHLIARSQAEAQRREQAFSDKLARRTTKSEQALDEDAMAAAKRYVVAKVVKHHEQHPEPGCPRNCVTTAVPGRLRQRVGIDAVLERCIAEQLISTTDDGRYVPGKRTS